MIIRKEYAMEIFDKTGFVRQEEVLQTLEECIAYILNNALQGDEYYKILLIKYNENEEEVSTEYL